MRRQRVIVAWGGVCLGKPCDPERVLSIRRIRGWDAEPIRPLKSDPGWQPGVVTVLRQPSRECGE